MSDAATSRPLSTWVESGNRRVYAWSQPGIAPPTLHTARNARVSFQVAARNTGGAIRLDARVDESDLPIRIRRIGLVPMRNRTPDVPEYLVEGLAHLPGLVPDPLRQAATGWLLHRFGARGFLHWGYNYWFQYGTIDPIDPYLHTDAAAYPRIAGGDPFIVYPGPDGPRPSIRWEVLRTSLDDLALLQALDVSIDDPVFDGVVGYDEFPNDPYWTDTQRRVLLERVAPIVERPR